MARGPLTFRQHDLERALRAAQKTGAGEVWVNKDGSIHIGVLAEETEGQLSHVAGKILVRADNKEIVL
jgi:hypothetical protein